MNEMTGFAFGTYEPRDDHETHEYEVRIWTETQFLEYKVGERYRIVRADSAEAAIAKLIKQAITTFWFVRHQQDHPDEAVRDQAHFDVLPGRSASVGFSARRRGAPDAPYYWSSP